MTDEQFTNQMHRLSSTFGANRFDPERTDLIKSFVLWMEFGDFAFMISNFISTFRSAPLPKDFKEAVDAHRQRHSPSIGRLTTQQVHSSGGLERTLEERGAKSLTEAFEIERLKIQVKNAKESGAK